MFAALVLMLASFAYFARYCDDSVFTTDATDYLVASGYGFWGNYLDSRSVGLWGAVATIRQHPELRSRFWDYLDRQGDAAAKRHFHVAFGFYPNTLLGTAPGQAREQRLLAAFEGGVVAAIIFAGLRWAGVRFFLAFLASLLFTISPSIVATNTDVSPHTLFTGVMMASAFALARFLETGRTAAALVSAAAFAIAAATLELSLVVAAVFAVVLGLRLRRKGWKAAVALLKAPVLVFFAVLALAWPAGVFRGSYLLSYGVFIFQALFHRESYFGTESLLTTFLRGGQGSGLVLAVIAGTAAMAVLLTVRGRGNAYVLVFGLLTAGFAAQGILNHFRNEAYASHFIALIWVLLALSVEQSLATAVGPGRRAAVLASAAVAFAVVLAASRWPAASALSKREQRQVSDRVTNVMGFVGRELPAGVTIVTNRYNGLWRYYMPRYRFEMPVDPKTLDPRPWAGIRNYWVIADPETASAAWRERLADNPNSRPVAGFIVSPVAVN
jgi:hypothetical protein